MKLTGRTILITGRGPASGAAWPGNCTNEATRSSSPGAGLPC
jgi:hypothetical protein